MPLKKLASGRFETFDNHIPVRTFIFLADESDARLVSQFIGAVTAARGLIGVNSRDKAQEKLRQRSDNEFSIWVRNLASLIVSVDDRSTSSGGRLGVDMTAPTAPAQARGTKRPGRVSCTMILILGVLVIPFALSAALNSYGPLTVESALRMAAASVAGQTIAILSAVGVVVLTVRRRHAAPAILVSVVIAAAVTFFAISSVINAGDLLLTRLDLIADIDKMNR